MLRRMTRTSKTLERGAQISKCMHDNFPIDMVRREKKKSGGHATKNEHQDALERLLRPQTDEMGNAPIAEWGKNDISRKVCDALATIAKTIAMLKWQVHHLSTA